MRSGWKYVCFLTVLLTYQIGLSQSVTVSREITLKNEVFYDIIGEVGGNIILYREKGDEYIFESYDRNLGFIKEREILFEEDRVAINGIVNHDSTFSIIYSYKHKKDIIHKLRKYDGDLILRDSTELWREPTSFKRKRYLVETSKNRLYTTLFEFEESNVLNCNVIRHDSMRFEFKKILEVEDLDLRDKFESLCITNNEEILVLLQVRNSRYSKGENNLGLFVLSNGPAYTYSRINVPDKVISDVALEVDNLNRRVNIVGLWHEKNKDEAQGYFHLMKLIVTLNDVEDVTAIEFTPRFLSDVSGKDVGKVSSLRDFELSDLVLRRDGGYILMAELRKEYARRSNYNMSGTGRGLSGWTDHFYEDVIAVAVHPDGREHWQEVFFKKQFSQDDGALFSSYYLVQTPSRLRILYNDEIKNNNTVSEYVVDPVGRYNRNSLLSTDYQNLKLRFADAKQISASEVIIPSEKNRRLSLVKIVYD